MHKMSTDILDTDIQYKTVGSIATVAKNGAL